MTDPIEKYPLDLTGEAQSNRIDQELKIVKDNLDFLITLNAGIFYSKNLIINSNEEQRVLELNKDYVLNFISEEVTVRSGNPAFSLIIITNENIHGDLLISYSAVGGEYTKLDSAMIAAIDQINSVESTAKWDSIINKPLTYPPSGHVHVADDIKGTNDIVESIDNLADAVQGEHPSKLEEVNKKLETKVSNLGYRRVSQVNTNWKLDTDNPMRISIKPFPSAIVVGIDIWQSNKGYINLEVAGELTIEGTWVNRSYRVTRGSIPSLELQLITIDGSSAEILMKSTDASTCYITPNVVTYLKHKPEVTSISCLDLDTMTVPIPDEYVTPVNAWTN